METRITANITGHLGQQDQHLARQDVAISDQGEKIDEIHRIDLERAARERATLELEEKAKSLAKERREKRDYAFKVVGWVLGAPATLIGLYTAARAIAAPLWRAVEHLFAK
jgi:hypothetical protein